MKNILFRIPLAGMLAVSAFYAQSGGSTGKAAPPRYVIKDLGPLPGAGFSYAPAITNTGLIAGWTSPLAGPRHATLWSSGVMVQDIGAQVPGAQTGKLNSEAFGINDQGQVAFQSETLDPNPSGEDFCGFTVLLASNPSCPLCSGSGKPHTCRPFRWSNGVVTPLAMLVDSKGVQGNNGGINQVNSRGDAVGAAENTTPDPDCQAPQKYEFKPVIWKNGRIHELAITSTDRNGFAFGINDRGQAVGVTGNCSAFDPAAQLYLTTVHGMLWEADGSPHEMNLPAGSSPGAINNRGQVTGSSGSYGFVWTQSGGMTSLNPLPADLLSFTSTINDAGEVVGGSLDATFTVLSAVVWPAGASMPVSLNDHIVDNPSGLYLQLAEGINSRGEISGFASSRTDLSDIPHGFLAIPIDASVTVDATAAPQDAVRPVVLSESARQMLQRRMRFGRFGAVPIRPR